MRLVQIYHPVYMSLIDILLLKSQYPQESEYASWNAGMIFIFLILALIWPSSHSVLIDWAVCVCIMAVVYYIYAELILFPMT